MKGLELAVEFLSAASRIAEDQHRSKPTTLHRLCEVLSNRFECFGKVSDIDEAITCGLRSISLSCCSSGEPQQLRLTLGNAYCQRYGLLGDLHDLDCAVEHRTKYLLLAPNDPAAHSDLGLTYRRRYERYNDLETLDSDLACQLKALSLAAKKDHVRPIILANTAYAYAARFDRLGKMDDLEDAIDYQLQAVEPHPETPLYRQAQHLSFLGNLFLARYKRMKAPDDIEKAISHHSQVVSMTQSNNVDRSEWLTNLGTSLLRRYTHAGQPEDLEMAKESFRSAAHTLESPPISRLRASISWARLCLNYKGCFTHALEAYSVTLSLLPKVAWLGACVSWRYNQVSSTENPAIEASMVAVDAGDNNAALEWLEQGRSIVWKQLLQLRTPVEELHHADPVLASRLEDTSSILVSSDNVNYPDGNKTSAQLTSLEQMGQKRRRAAEEWDDIIEQARRLPGFSSFMKPVEARELFKAASASTVIVLLLYECRCSALIIRKGAQHVEHVSLPRFNSAKATRVCKTIRESLASHKARGTQRGFTRKKNAPEAANYFRHALTTLWLDIVQPILDYLGYIASHSPQQLPRVTWCCTGPISFLPLHAAGDYTGEESSRTFNYVISSYVPTVANLIPPTSGTPQFTGVLAVSQAQTPGQNPLPGTTDELNRISSILNQLPFTSIRDESATCDVVMSAMRHHGWVHFACHATQNFIEPQSSAFLLQDGKLPLQRIVEKQIKCAEFAFLSACQTAMGDESVPDEAVHLAAGMLMAGYRSVIATMWSIRDEDAPLVAEHVYRHLLEHGAPDAQRAAVALHKAVAKLRETVGEDDFVAWVPYIHLGQ